MNRIRAQSAHVTSSSAHLPLGATSRGGDDATHSTSRLPGCRDIYPLDHWPGDDDDVAYRRYHLPFGVGYDVTDDVTPRGGCGGNTTATR